MSGKPWAIFRVTVFTLITRNSLYWLVPHNVMWCVYADIHTYTKTHIQSPSMETHYYERLVWTVSSFSSSVNNIAIGHTKNHPYISFRLIFGSSLPASPYHVSKYFFLLFFIPLSSSILLLLPLSPLFILIGNFQKIIITRLIELTGIDQLDWVTNYYMPLVPDSL